MNKNNIKTFAVWARNELIIRVTQKAYEYGVENNNIIDVNANSINDKLLTIDEKKQRQQLINEVNKKGFDQVIEEVAYTWFNRFIALRYMEVNNYLPNKIRVFTNENNEFKPQILDEAINVELEGLDKERVFELLESNNQEELYKQLLIATCNDMGNYLPGMFTKISDYKVLLFPNNILNKENVLGKLISDIDEDSWMEQVQIIGWLYQYYIQMPKDELIHAKKQYNNNDVPFVTQLFTPEWIVKYMVESSLGNYYLKINEETNLNKNWSFFIKNNSKCEATNQNFENITFLDPAMGSGHILVYAFDILIQLYKENGYSERDAAVFILQNNLYGLDIDERAYQLTYFALMMKARKYNRRILYLNVEPNVYCMKNLDENDELITYLSNGNSNQMQLLNKIFKSFSNINTLGSIIETFEYSKNELNDLLSNVQNLLKIEPSNLFEMDFNNNIQYEIIPSLKILLVLLRKYDIVVTNPPYMSSSLMPKDMKNYILEKYNDFKNDLFAVFINKCITLTKENGYIGMVTPNVWMFISTYEKFRNYLLTNTNISSLIQLEYNAFPAACVPVTTFVLHNTIDRYDGNYIKLSDFKGVENQAPKVLEAINNHACGYYYEITSNEFTKIPGSPIAYSVNKAFIKLFDNDNILNYFSFKRGIATGDNDKFLRLWFEPSTDKICFNGEILKMKWFPYNKGGDYRKWYGNKSYLINWQKDGYEVKNNFKNGKQASRPQNIAYNFMENISYSSLTSGELSFRRYKGFINDQAGNYFIKVKDMPYNVALGLLNSKVASYCIGIKNATLNTTADDFKSIPVISQINEINKIDYLVNDCLCVCEKDWNSFETSWNFKKHPFIVSRYDFNDAFSYNMHSKERIENVTLISNAFKNWYHECNERFNNLKLYEEELNRIFIDIYELKDELTPEVDDKDVSVRKADLSRDIKSFISYAVGCMFGRYSLDFDGLIYAGGKWDDNKYKSFIPDKDNIIPICDDEYFEDDVVGKFIKFVEAVYGSDTLEINLKFIADALGGKGTPREIVRQYFLNDFFKDHCNTYQVTGSGKRPIYWLFDSGKNNGFKALIYMHRYTPDLIARMRTQYIHEQQARYRNQIELLENQIGSDISTSERVRLNKKLKTLKEQDEELRKYEEKIHHWADKMEPMDLDDGVKANYAKFQELLAKIK